MDETLRPAKKQSVGNFWPQALWLRHEELTTFHLRSGTIRVRLGPDVDLATADLIVKAIERRDFLSVPRDAKSWLRMIRTRDLWTIYRERKRGTISAAFSMGSGSIVLEVKVHGGKVTLDGFEFSFA